MGVVMIRWLTLSLMLALPAAAQNQTNPEEEWSKIPSSAPPPPPPPRGTQQNGDAPPPPPSSMPGPEAGPPRPVLTQPRPVLEPNTVSMFGARSLGQWGRGQMFYLGFPLLGIRLSPGV